MQIMMNLKIFLASKKSLLINLDSYNPYRISLTNHLITLSPLFLKTERFFYEYTDLLNNIGEMFENIKYYNRFNFKRKESECLTRTIEDFNDPEEIKTLSTSFFEANTRKIQI